MENLNLRFRILTTITGICAISIANAQTQRFFLSLPPATRTLTIAPETGGGFYNESFASGSRSWLNPSAITGDISGTNYEFHIYLSSAGSTTFGGEILINGVVTASTSFIVSSASFAAFGGPVTGTDPTLSGTSSLEFRLTHQSGNPGAVLWGDFGTDDSFIATPVPEPASLAVLALGAGILARRRQKISG